LNNALIIAQITDSHLFAQVNSLHCGKNVYQNFVSVLAEIKQNKDIDYLIFTGDLTQDHSEESYQLFARAIEKSKISVPVLFLSGNHDDTALLNKHLKNIPFISDKLIQHNDWQIILVESKSKVIVGPSGRVDDDELLKLSDTIDSEKRQLIFMHHHPVDVGYFIDKHGLKQADIFWNTINKHSSISAIACGHIHRALTLSPAESTGNVTVYTCPATSIQFDPLANSVQALEQGPGYRLFYLDDQKKITTSVHYIDEKDINENRQRGII
jgi:Icc protein